MMTMTSIDVILAAMDKAIVPGQDVLELNHLVVTKTKHSVTFIVNAFTPNNCVTV